MNTPPAGDPSGREIKETWRGKMSNRALTIWVIALTIFVAVQQVMNLRRLTAVTATLKALSATDEHLAEAVSLLATAVTKAKEVKP